MTFLCRLRNDDVARRIPTDPLLLKFGTSMFLQKGEEGFNDFSQRLRAASRILGQLRHVIGDCTATLLDFMHPEYWPRWEKTFDYFMHDNSLLIRMGQALLSIFPFARGYLLKNQKPIDSLLAFQDLFR